MSDIPHEIDLTPPSEWVHEWYTPVGAYDLGKVKETCEEAKPCEGHDHEEYVPE
jgi:hypothetical protein